MKSIVEINEEVFCYLDGIRKEKRNDKRPFLFTLRKTNMRNRLSEGYWFHGNEDYLAVSFWEGNDWKSRTPNIFFTIKPDGRTSLDFRTKDSLIKTNNVRKLFLKELGLGEYKENVLFKDYDNKDYLRSIEEFINHDKIKIDNLIEKNSSIILSDDKSNSISFINEKDFNIWYEKVQQYRQKIINTSIPYVLRSISIKKYIPIEEILLDNIKRNTQFIFLVGENGSGKSSFLKAVATAVGNKYYKENMSPDNSAWIIDFAVNVGQRISRQSIDFMNPFYSNNNNIPFASYGPSRLISDISPQRNIFNEAKEDLTHPLRGIFYPDNILRDFNKWLLMNLSNPTKILSPEKANLRFNIIRAMLIDIIPNLANIKPINDKDFNELLYVEMDENEIPFEKGVIFEHTSSGLRSLISMIGDMMIRLFDQQPEITDTAELGGIVLIDEIDIHLHPKWQKILPQVLSQYFPKIQFIVTTHSPIPLLGAPKNSTIYVIARNIEKGIYLRNLDYLHVEDLLPNTIFTSPIFGMDTLVADSNRNISEVNIDDSIQDTEFYEVLDKKLEELVKKDDLINKRYFEKDEKN